MDRARGINWGQVRVPALYMHSLRFNTQTASPPSPQCSHKQNGVRREYLPKSYKSRLGCLPVALGRVSGRAFRSVKKGSYIIRDLLLRKVLGPRFPPRPHLLLSLLPFHFLLPLSLYSPTILPAFLPVAMRQAAWLQ